MKRTLVCLMALLSLMVVAQTQDNKMGDGLPYAFDGAEAQYKISYGSTSSAAKMTVNISKTDPDWCNVAFRYSGQLAPLSRDGRLLCDHSNQPFWVGPVPLIQLKGWKKGYAIPPGYGGATEIRHSVAVSVPAGNFLTEEIYQPDAAGYYEASSGLLVKMEGNLFKGAGEQVPALKGVTKATMVLIKTNIPMTLAPTGN